MRRALGWTLVCGSLGALGFTIAMVCYYNPIALLAVALPIALIAGMRLLDE